MKVFAISDLHFSFHPEIKKPMDIFGWPVEHYNLIKKNWFSKVSDDDLVLVPGDLSWALYLRDAKYDINFLDSLPGTKVIIKGNHDLWWSSYNKVKALLEGTKIIAIQNNAIKIDNLVICGTRLWLHPQDIETEHDQKVYDRECIRLKMSLDEAMKLKSDGDKLIVLTHYPPLVKKNDKTSALDIIESYPVDHVIFGHLHGKHVKQEKIIERNNIKYYLTACDIINFDLIEIV